MNLSRYRSELTTTNATDCIDGRQLYRHPTQNSDTSHSSVFELDFKADDDESIVINHCSEKTTTFS